MIVSMTGYGSSSLQDEKLKIFLEVKSVNSRYLDINLRLPKELSHLELPFRNSIKRKVPRGRVDAFVALQVAASDLYSVNSALIANYLRIAETLGSSLPGRDQLDVATLLQLPGVVELQPLDLTARDGQLTERVVAAFEQALDLMVQMKIQEGRAIAEDLLRMLAGIEQRVLEITKHGGEIKEAYYQKLKLRLLELREQVPIDENRIVQEVLFYVDRSDITEELTRLASHLLQLSRLIRDGGEVGKKMDFLLQEMNREINTTLAKSSSAVISEAGVWIKAEIEKMREQVQNVE